MNVRERFLRVMSFEPADRTLKWEFGYWAGAVRRWYAEGLPRQRGVPAQMGDGEGLRGEASAMEPGVPRADDVHDFF